MDSEDLLDLSHDAMIALDDQGAILYWNKTACELYGWTPEEVKGKNSHELLSSEFSEPLEKIHRELQTVGTWEGIVRHRDRYGNPIVVESRWVRKGERIYKINRDVTETMRLQALHELFFKHSLDLLCVADTRGNFLELNPQWENMLGYSVEELKGRSYFELVHPDDVEKTKLANERLADGKPVLGFENRYRSKTGEYLWLLWSATVTPEGKVLAVAREITGRRQIEDAHRRLSAIVQATTDFVASCAPDGKIVYLNKAGRAMAGLPAYGDVHCRIQDLLSPETVQRLESEGLAIARRHGAWSHDGGLGEIPVSLQLLPELSGPNYSLILRDMTARLEFEKELRRARVEAEAANQAKSEFLAQMSHELRTPLNAIIGFSEVLVDQAVGPLNPKQSRYMNNVLNSGRQLLQLINDILDLSKIEAGRMDLGIEDVDISDVVAQALEGISALADQKHQRLLSSVSPELPKVRADRGRMVQVLNNLLSNAIKFTPEGGEIRVDATLDRETVIVSVIDTGIGIKPEHHERIFLPFEQVDSTFKRHHQGTGLGLALTRRLIEMHGGQVWVESRGVEGEGTRFSFSLPALDRGWLGPQDGPRVLVIEDNEPAAELLELYLQRSGYRTLRAVTGQHALQLAMQTRPDAITLDLALPDLDGWRVLEQLREREETREIPVVIVTMSDDRQRGLTLGASGYIVKPVEQDHFLEVMESSMAGQRRRVLILDDDPVFANVLCKAMEQRGHHVQVATQVDSGLRLARDYQPDVLLLGLLLTEATAIDVLQKLRSDERTRELSVMLVASRQLSPEDRARLNGSIQAVVSKSNQEEMLSELDSLLQRVKKCPRS